MLDYLTFVSSLGEEPVYAADIRVILIVSLWDVLNSNRIPIVEQNLSDALLYLSSAAFVGQHDVVVAA